MLDAVAGQSLLALPPLCSAVVRVDEIEEKGWHCEDDSVAVKLGSRSLPDRERSRTGARFHAKLDAVGANPKIVESDGADVLPKSSAAGKILRETCWEKFCMVKCDFCFY